MTRPAIKLFRVAKQLVLGIHHRRFTASNTAIIVDKKNAETNTFPIDSVYV